MEFLLKLASHVYSSPGVLVAAFAAVILLWNSIVIVGGNELAVMERRYFGGEMPEGHVIAMPGQVGVQARTLSPGLHLLIPFLFKIQKLEFVVIKDDQVGMVESIDGKAVPAGRIFARVVEGHNSFQDAEGFLSAGGEKGPQIEIVPPGNYRINTAQFRVSTNGTVIIPKGKIGLVTAMDGMPIPTGRLLAQHVDGHSSFQSGQVFLASKGQKGPQIDVLLPGAFTSTRICSRLKFVMQLRCRPILSASSPRWMAHPCRLPNLSPCRIPATTIFRTRQNSLTSKASAGRSTTPCAPAPITSTHGCSPSSWCR